MLVEFEAVGSSPKLRVEPISRGGIRFATRDLRFSWRDNAPLAPQANRRLAWSSPLWIP